MIIYLLFYFAIVIVRGAINSTMQYLGKRKISVQSSTPSHAYPTVRLPREYKGLVGKKAALYVDEYPEQLVFEIVISQKVDNFCANSKEDLIEARLSELESEFEALKSLIMKNNSFLNDFFGNRAQLNGLGRIRTGDLRRVKATS